MRRKILSDTCELDEFLSTVAHQYPSHAFLGNATQMVFLRQVALLKEYSQLVFDKPSSKLKVLDWGCGKGHISYLLAKEGFQVTSCDRKNCSNDSAFGQEVPILKSKNISVIPLEHDVQLPFENSTFDLVVSFGVLEHVPRDKDSLMEIHRILKPGGIFFIFFLPYILSWTQFVSRMRGEHYHDRLYTSRKLRQLAAQTGWEIVDVWHGQLFPKNSISYSPNIEKIDRFLTAITPLCYFATNLEAIFVRPATGYEVGPT